ncbi:C-3 sterol dehydrogenase [Coprinopsis marcescibilis]|uniref:C-3 sterol dehydrogenase n=1 Tax=Coprinopsis marcescibilis TaxID=230819 RepID=A0A5C3L5D2_COPMA|nr:C-3 sterol dehydrogenase [Coprinopsis marcescibilis]
MTKTKDVYIVVGGNGFLGRHIVTQLKDRGDIVSSLDIVQRYDDVAFYSADITDEDQVASALKRSGATCIIHTASPPANLKDESLYYKVNVEGTRAIINAAIQCGVRKLVFTSSAGVVFNGADNVDVDERLPYPDVPMDAYNDSKAKAEQLVLESNGKGGLLTVALRPAGIFGPGDRQMMTGLYQVYENNKTHFQIGDNTNLFDWTYVGNVAYAHLLAADKLDLSPPAPPISQLEKVPVSMDELPPLNDAERDIVETNLPPIDKTTGKHQVPTCIARPLGPYLHPPENAEEIETRYHNPADGSNNRPVARNRFDQLSPTGINQAKLHYPDKHPLQVAGQAFFITNGEPTYFWDFMRYIWHHLDAFFPGHRTPRKPFVLPKLVGLALAQASEWGCALVGVQPTFTKFKVTFSCASRWHNIEKARRVLGYHPQVGLQEGVKLTVDWWWAEYQKGSHKTAH